MNNRLRELIQQLGEAIHLSVSESEQIAHVVEEIRTEGYDVVMMLEATFGLSEAGKTIDAEDAEDADGDSASPTEFTQHDLHFLRSLRISVEGEVTETQSPDESSE